MRVPFLNLKILHDPLRKEIDQAIAEVIDNNAFAGGKFVSAFESDFADYCQCQHAIGVGSGTDALWFALLALGVGPGDEVITVPNTFIATVEAISFAGAKPVFVDVDPKTYNMDPAQLEQAITPRTKAVIPVHLFGQIADMDPILEVTRRHGIPVIEDASQAHGAEYKGKRAGSMGDFGCFSFYPGKNLGAFGEGGAVVTQDESLAKKVACLRDHGQESKYHHSVIGWNGRMDGIQGAVLQIKLRHLPEGNQQRRDLAANYTRLLQGTEGVVLPAEPDFSRAVYHLYVIQVDKRDDLIAALRDKEIACGIHYPVPIHLTGAYASLGLGKGSFPVAEAFAERCVSLPMFPGLLPEQQEMVAGEIKTFIHQT